MPFLISQGSPAKVFFIRLEDTSITGSHPRDITLPFSPVLAGEQLKLDGIGYCLIELSSRRLPPEGILNKIADCKGIVFLEINFSGFEYFTRLLSSLPRRPEHIAAYGLMAHSEPERILEKEIEYCITGEAESNIPPFVKWILQSRIGEPPAGLQWTENGKLVGSGPGKSLGTDDMPFVPSSILRTNRYHKHSFPLVTYQPLRWGFILANRGCLYNCEFCSAVARQSVDKKYRMCRPERLIDEMEYQVREGKRNVISIEDDLFTGDSEWIHEVCEQLITRGWHHPWIAQTRFDCINDEIAVQMKEAGCIGITCGLESGCNRILDILNKQTSVRDIRETAAILKHHGFAERYTAMIGSPGETNEDLNKTFSLLKELNPLTVQLYYCTPFPDTDYSQNVDTECELKRLDKVPPVELSHINAEDIEKYRFGFYLGYYISIRYLREHWHEWAGYLLFNPIRGARLFVKFMIFTASKFGALLRQESL